MVLWFLSFYFITFSCFLESIIKKRDFSQFVELWEIPLLLVATLIFKVFENEFSPAQGIRRCVIECNASRDFVNILDSFLPHLLFKSFPLFIRSFS